MLLISLQQMLKKLHIISQAHLLHHELTHCVLKKFNNPNPKLYDKKAGLIVAGLDE